MMNKEEFIPDYNDDFCKDNGHYIIDLKWFDKIRCKRPQYQCANFIEYYILNDDNEVIDTIKLPPKPFVDTLYEVDKETYYKIKSYMKDETKNTSDYSDNQNLTFLEPIETVSPNVLPKNFILDCDNIYLNQKSIDLEIQIPTEKIKQFDYIILNGIKFKKENKN